MTKQILVSIELTNYCTKGCDFCYATSTKAGQTMWEPDVLAGFVKDLAANGVEAVSFGGGEPLEYGGLWPFLNQIKDVPVFKSMTTNGLRLSPEVLLCLQGKLNKLHISIHFPERPTEILRVLRQVKEAEAAGLRSGINMVLKGEDLEAEKAAVRQIKEAGIEPDRVVFLPLRGKGKAPDMVKFRAVAELLGPKWQSTWCLLACKRSDRFVSVDWQGRVGWCSYTEAKTKMAEFTYAGMLEALRSKDLVYCG